MNQVHEWERPALEAARDVSWGNKKDGLKMFLEPPPSPDPDFLSCSKQPTENWSGLVMHKHINHGRERCDGGGEGSLVVVPMGDCMMRGERGVGGFYKGRGRVYKF